MKQIKKQYLEMYALRQKGMLYTQIGEKYGMTHQGASSLIRKWFGKTSIQKKVKIICLECSKESFFAKRLKKAKFCNINCWRQYVSKNKKKINIEIKRLKQREQTKKYYALNKKKVYEIVRKSEKKYPQKQKARIKVHYAVKKGILQKPILCTICLTNKATDGHHEDYNKPLEVIWCCRVCHRMLDKRLKNSI